MEIEQQGPSAKQQKQNWAVFETLPFHLIVVGQERDYHQISTIISTSQVAKQYAHCISSHKSQLDTMYSIRYLPKTYPIRYNKIISLW